MVEPYYYVKNGWVYRRPVKRENSGNITLGFRVCIPADGVDGELLANILNAGDLA